MLSPSFDLLSATHSEDLGFLSVLAKTGAQGPSQLPQIISAGLRMHLRAEHALSAYINIPVEL